MKKQDDKLRILHIWNTAGVGSVIAKFMDSFYPTESQVVMRKSFDKFGFTTTGEVWDCGSTVFCLKAFLKARKFDVLHIHGVDKIIPYIRTCYGNKPIILHYHGTDIRDRWREKEHLWFKANKVFYSTEDVWTYDYPNAGEYLPNPIDTDLFFPDGDIERVANSALSFRYGADEVARQFAKANELSLILHDRENSPIPYVELRRFLCQFEYYIDAKYVGHSLSKTALEALACGCKVISKFGNIITRLPEDHKPHNVAQRIWQIYNELGISKDIINEYGHAEKENDLLTVEVRSEIV